MAVKEMLSKIKSDPSLRARAKEFLNSIGFDTTHWCRVVMYQECFRFIRTLSPENLDVLEIAAGPQWLREFTFRSYTGTQFPEFDICAHTLPQRFDLIIADQVFEHLRWPYRAGRHVFEMLKPGGYFIVTTPFLIRVHRVPIDCSRWTQDGLSCLLQECGFPEDHITTGAWGNRACLKATLKSWRMRGFFGSLNNEVDFPLTVWAFAQRPKVASDAARPQPALA